MVTVTELERVLVEIAALERGACRGCARRRRLQRWYDVGRCVFAVAGVAAVLAVVGVIVLTATSGFPSVGRG